MTEPDTTRSPSSPLPSPQILRPVPRNTIIAGYIISLEDGARWANKIWAEHRIDPLPTDLETSPTVLGIINRDFRKRGGLGVHFNIIDIRNQVTTTRYIVTTQTKYGRWVNSWPETNGREIVRDPGLQLREGEEDRRILEGLKEDGMWRSVTSGETTLNNSVQELFLLSLGVISSDILWRRMPFQPTTYID